MNKTIWALAFVVLCSGMVSAIENASATQISQSGWSNATGAGHISTEGGNVSDVDVSTGQSTEKWAGAFGNVTGDLLLAQVGDSNFLYTWAYSAADGGEVCVSANNNPTWSLIGSVVTIAQIDSYLGFTSADADSATNTLTESGSFSIGGITQGAAPAVTTNTGVATTWQTGALNVSSTATDVTAFAFCVNISNNGANYKSGTSDYQAIMPTDDTEGPGVVDNYYFYLELI